MTREKFASGLRNNVEVKKTLNSNKKNNQLLDGSVFLDNLDSAS